LGYSFPVVKVQPYFLPEIDCATFWAIFSQTQLVTLLISSLPGTDVMIFAIFSPKNSAKNDVVDEKQS
jgi:hypothetical protein